MWFWPWGLWGLKIQKIVIKVNFTHFTLNFCVKIDIFFSYCMLTHTFLFLKFLYSPNFSQDFFHHKRWDSEWVCVYVHIYVWVCLFEKCIQVHTHTLLILEHFLWTQQCIFNILFIPYHVRSKFIIPHYLQTKKSEVRWITFLTII